MSRQRRTDWTKLAILLALGALLVHCCQRSLRAEPTTRPTTRPFDLRSDDAGRLVFTPLEPDKTFLGAGRYWSGTEDARVQFDNYRPACYFSGRVCAWSEAGTVEVAGWREVYHDWTVIRFALTQTPGETLCEYTVRTPVGQPDVTIQIRERHTAILFLMHKEVEPMLVEVLKGIGCPAYSPGPFVRDQLAGDVRVTAEVAERVGVLMGLLDSPHWQTRDRAANALRGMGVEGAKGLLSLDRRKLTPAQGLGVSVALSRWPVIQTGERKGSN